MNGRYLIEHESASLQLIVGPATVHLINFRALDKRQGHGTACMQKAVDWADQEGRTIHLTADGPGHFHKDWMSNKQLAEFYKRFGFVEDMSWANSRAIRMIRVVR